MQLQRFVIISLLISIIVASCGQMNKNTLPEEESILPNIVLIIGDDHGYPYFGFMGADYIQTPEMDKLAESGIVFTNAYVPSNHCAPSLQTLMTGTIPIQYQQQLKKNMEKEKQEEHYLSLNETAKREWERNYRFHAMKDFETLPRLLAKKGYKSWQGGKWWEFSYQNGGFTEGMTMGWKKEDMKKEGWFLQFMGGEGTELVRKTMQPFYDFVDKNKEDPMFIWFAPELPHYPLNAPDRFYDIYKDKDMTESAKRYYANCTWFDEGISDLVNHLKEKGEFDNTLFVYVNDNGWEQNPDQEFRHDSLRWHNGGDKGKLSVYDMSFRTPVLFSWKDTIKAGIVKEDFLHSSDIPATILDFVGIPIPEDYYGKSFKEVILGKTEGPRSEIIGRAEQMRWEGDMMGKDIEAYWLRNDQWFFSWNLTLKTQELFNMTQDPFNDYNVAKEHPEKVEAFVEKIKVWRRALDISEE
jgi:arylsulfatase A-like enzyme